MCKRALRFASVCLFDCLVGWFVCVFVCVWGGEGTGGWGWLGKWKALVYSESHSK